MKNIKTNLMLGWLLTALGGFGLAMFAYGPEKVQLIGGALWVVGCAIGASQMIRVNNKVNASQATSA